MLPTKSSHVVPVVLLGNSRQSALTFRRHPILGRDADNQLHQAQYGLYKGGRNIGTVTLINRPHKGRHTKINFKSSVRLADNIKEIWEQQELDEPIYGARLKQTDYQDLYNRKEALSARLRLGAITINSYISQYKALVSNPPFYYVSALTERRDDNKMAAPLKELMRLIELDFINIK